MQSSNKRSNMFELMQTTIANYSHRSGPKSEKEDEYVYVLSSIGITIPLPNVSPQSQCSPECNRNSIHFAIRNVTFNRDIHEYMQNAY